MQATEVQVILNKARHYKMTAEFDESVEEGFTRLVVSGPQIDLFMKNAKSWAPNVRVQGNVGPGKIAFLWSKSRIAEPVVEQTKPKGAISDGDVLAAVPQRQMLTEAELMETLKVLREKIEAAYPGVSIGGSGFGKGKRDLLFSVLDKLYTISSRGLPRFMSLCVVGLMDHFQTTDKSPITLPSQPAAMATR